MRIMRNTTVSGNTLLDRAVETVASRLPRGWRLSLRKPAGGRKLVGDARLTLRAPDGRSAELIAEARQGLSPRQAAEAAALLASAGRQGGADGTILISDYLSELSRIRLRAAGVNYLDLTGNAWIVIDRPALLIETQGADRNPAPDRRGSRTLKGGKAARIVRALCDVRPPTGVRELARLSATNAGYVSRVLTLLSSEDLVQREASGRVVQADWLNLIRRWSRDYSLVRTNRAVAYLAPRGIETLSERLLEYEGTYALTGTLAVPKEASVAEGRAVMCYVDEPERAAGFLEVRPADAGANVLLLTPFDTVVYDRARTEDGLRKVALSQCVADLLTGGGRGPAEADALLGWMARNEDAWRS